MLKVTERIFSTGSLYFLLIQAAAVFLAYLVSIIAASLSNIVEEKNARLSWIIDALTPACLLFIMGLGFGIGFDFLPLTLQQSANLEPAKTIVILLAFAVLLAQFVPALLLRTIRGFSVNTARIVQAGISVICAALLIVLYIGQVKALVLSLVLGLIFYLLTAWMLSKPKPRVMQQPVIPKRLVITHIYVSTSESHENIEKSVRLITEAIQETTGTGDSPQVSPSGFIPGAVDIIVKYFVMDASQMEQIKSRVNLNILKKLNEKSIKLAST